MICGNGTLLFTNAIGLFIFLIPSVLGKRKSMLQYAMATKDEKCSTSENHGGGASEPH